MTNTQNLSQQSTHHRTVNDNVNACNGQQEPVASPPPSSKYIIAFDFGSTNIKACCFDTHRVQLALATEIAYEYAPEPTVSGLIEINADHLLSCFHRILEALFQTTSAIDGIPGRRSLHPDDIECIAFTGQRNSFITWHADTGRPFHQFISWKNSKPEHAYTRRWNANYFLRAGKKLARLAYHLSGSQRMYIMSNFYFMSKQVLPRLKWCIDRVPELRAAMSEGKARIGGIETWMTWRLSHGEKFVVDKTFACGTGLFQPVQMRWSTLLRVLFRIPYNMLPEVIDSCTHQELAQCFIDIRGSKRRCWPLKAMCEDQQAAMFAALEYGLPQKITLGTGSFFNALVGCDPIYDQESGIYPLRQCCLPNTESRNWIAEASLPALGETMEWALEQGLNMNAEFLPLSWQTAPLFDYKTRTFVEQQQQQQSRRSSSNSNTRTSTALAFLSIDEILYGCSDESLLNDAAADEAASMDDDDIDADIRTVTNIQQKAANERQHKRAHADAADTDAVVKLSSPLSSITKTLDMRRHLLAYSVLEGCAFSLYENLLRIQRRIPFDEKIGVDGGISNNALLLRALSTLLGVVLVKCACTNGSALGVALLAFFSRERDSLADKMRDVNIKLNYGTNLSSTTTRHRRRSVSQERITTDKNVSTAKSAGASPTRSQQSENGKSRSYYRPQFSYDSSEEFISYEPDRKMSAALHSRFTKWGRIFSTTTTATINKPIESRRSSRSSLYKKAVDTLTQRKAGVVIYPLRNHHVDGEQ